jgi:hypothetical protein
MGYVTRRLRGSMGWGEQTEDKIEAKKGKGRIKKRREQ